jgi:hypothetical protein
MARSLKERALFNWWTGAHRARAAGAVMPMGFSLRAHPLKFARQRLSERGICLQHSAKY